MMRPPEGFYNVTGAALILGGLLTALINIFLTPQLDPGSSFAAIAGSSPFLTRLVLAGIAALLVLIGSTGIYARQAEETGAFGLIAFLLAVIGMAALFANEWMSVFAVHEIARSAPEAMEALEESALAEAGAIIAMGLSVTGWFALAGVTLRVGILPRWASVSVIAGFVLVMVLPALIGIRGAAVGNTVLGAGWMGLGWSVARHE
jgi:hypothetical protein